MKDFHGLKTNPTQGFQSLISQEEFKPDFRAHSDSEFGVGVWSCSIKTIQKKEDAYVPKSLAKFKRIVIQECFI
jgi:hypothetical protein